jgi:hypothetical protein
MSQTGGGLMTARSETKTLIARQISLIEGRSWHQLSTAKRLEYLTHAENLLATVERKLRAEDNCLLDHLADWR